jgi:tight adherence protein C
MDVKYAAHIADLLFCLIVIAGLVGWLQVRGSSRVRIGERARALASTGVHVVSRDAQGVGVRQRLARRMVMLGERLPLFDVAQRTKLAAQLQRAGFRGMSAVSALIGAKLLGGALFGAMIFASAGNVPSIRAMLFVRMLVGMAGFMLGMIVPEYALNIYARGRVKKIAKALPDALDLLVICSNAGNSLGVGIARLAREMSWICPPLADELGVASDEIQLSGDIVAALRGLAERTGLPSMRSLVGTLAQSQQYGTPISQALKVLARTERNAYIMALEEKAAKLAPKMTIPMMLFILPTVVLIAVGPAILSFIKYFK